jgi:hypothetical protein
VVVELARLLLTTEVAWLWACSPEMPVYMDPLMLMVLLL